MISSMPWVFDETDTSTIYDANGEIIAKDYRFLHIDDFECICDFVNAEFEKRKIKDVNGKSGFLIDSRKIL